MQPSYVADNPIRSATQLEAELASIWAVVLDTERVAVDDDFFDLGGHSLLAIELRHRIREHFQAPFLNPDVLATSTVAAMAEEMVRSIAERLDGADRETMQ